MRERLVSSLTLGLAILSLAGYSASAASPELRNSQIDIAYSEPGKAEYRPIYERLKARKVLEELQAFLAPLKLPKRVLVEIEQCNAPDRPYQPDAPVVICYEYVAQLEGLAAKIPADVRTERGVSREDAVVGAFVQVVLQRMSSAVFDVLDVPVWGREQDAADKLAAFLMLQFGRQSARKLLNGAAYFFEASNRTWSGSDFSDTRSPDAQRFYNYLCVAYGGDKKTFGDFIEGGMRRSGPVRFDLLPQHRADRCAEEYSDLKWAFDNTIMPSVDRALLEEVLARNWLNASDGK